MFGYEAAVHRSRLYIYGTIQQCCRGLYDIIMNDYIISHLYSYLIIYMPIMIFKRITTLCGQNANEVCRFLYNLYYTKEKLLANGDRWEREIAKNISLDSPYR